MHVHTCMYMYMLVFNNLFLQIKNVEKFKYRVEVINPKAKELIVIDWHGKFTTVADLKERLVSTQCTSPRVI